MTVTYPHDRPLPPTRPMEAAREEPFVPVYARTRTSRRRKGGIKTWMILAPLGVLVLGAGAAAMMMGGNDDVAPAPLVEPAATAPVLPAQPLLTNVAPLEATPVATPAPAPAARRAAPAPRPRATSTARVAAPAPAPTTPVVVAPEPASPQPYTASLNSTPAAPAPAPVIVIQPAD